jgi:hypothetical protein
VVLVVVLGAVDDVVDGITVGLNVAVFVGTCATYFMKLI